MPRGLTTVELLDKKDIVAFLDGPVVLAGICEEDRILYGDKGNPDSILIPDKAVV